MYHLNEIWDEIWDKEEIPTEWKTGMQVTILKKSNLSECKNWSGIMLHHELSLNNAF